MFSIIGIVVVFGCIVAGYLMDHGNLKVLLQPAELIIILGAAIGTVLIANPLHILTKMGGGLAGVFSGKYLVKSGADFRVVDSLRPHITFSRLNLLDDSKMLFMRGLDAVFCCNVLIYFDGKSKGRTVQHFYNALLPNGYFFLGHSESLFGINDKFRLVHFPGATAYWKSAEAATKVGAA